MGEKGSQVGPRDVAVGKAYVSGEVQKTGKRQGERKNIVKNEGAKNSKNFCCDA